MDRYNPFGKPYSDLTFNDLEILKTVCEGWFVEYKSCTPKASKIAKSIASFSNSYGGIYFLGVTADKETNKAIDFVGVKDNADKIHDSVRGNLNPFPFFDLYLIPVPETGKNIIIVVVAQGDDPPYIHNDGKIYRRNESSSDPIPENDRHTIDKIYEKKYELKKRKENFREIEYGFCRGEDETPFLSIFVTTEPFLQSKIDGFFDPKSASDLLNFFCDSYCLSEKLDGEKDCNITGSISLDSVQGYSTSFAFRSIANSDIAYNSITLELDCYGNLKALIPLQFKIFDRYSLYENQVLADYLYSNRIESFDTIKFISGKQLFGVILAVLSRYYDYLISKKINTPLELMYETKNCYRISIYIDDDNIYEEYLNKFGLPVCLKSSQRFPLSGTKIDLESYRNRPVSEMIAEIDYILCSFGIVDSYYRACCISDYQR